MNNVFALCVLCAISVLPIEVFAQTPGTVAIVGGQLIDGHGSTPVHRSVVVLEGKRIKAVGREGELAVPSGAKVIDAHGMTVMPGLIDMHVHLVLLGGGVTYDHWVWASAPGYGGPNRTLEVMKVAAKELLMNGVTTARDLGGDTKLSVAFRDAINQGKEVGPRMFVTGAFISRACRYLAQPAFCTQITSPQEAAEAGRQRLAAQVDWLKAWGVQPEDWRALTEVAHQAQKQVAGHWVGPQVKGYGMNSGDSLEHMQPLTPEVIQDIARAGVWVVPTFIIPVSYKLTETFPERLDNTELKKDVAPDLWSMIHESVLNFQRLSYFGPAIHQRIRAAQEQMKQLLNSPVAGRLLIGTDAGTALNFHTDATRNEIKIFTEWGMPPLEAITAATSLAARALGKEDEFGSLDPGKSADLIVIDGNPLEDMVVLKNVVYVFKEGVQYK